MSAAGQTCRSHLAKAEFAPDAPDFFTLLFSFTKYQFVTGRCIAPCAIGIKLHFSASPAAPPRQPLNFNPRAAMLDCKGLFSKRVIALRDSQFMHFRAIFTSP